MRPIRHWVTAHHLRLTSQLIDSPPSHTPTKLVKYLYNMRTFLLRCTLCLLLLVLLLPGVVHGQVTTNSGSGLAPTYASLAEAIVALNAIGTATEPTTITLDADEVAPLGGLIITASGTSGARITIDGDGNTLTAFTPQTLGSFHDALIEIRGGDHITVQGFTLLENPANTTTGASNNMTEWGIALLRASATNGPQNCSVLNNTISLNRAHANTFGIYSNIHHDAESPSSSSDITSVDGAQSNLVVQGNAISDVNQGIVVVGSSTAAYMPTGVFVGGSTALLGNSIADYGTTPTLTGSSAPFGTSWNVNGILVHHVSGVQVVYNSLASSNGGMTTSGNLRGIAVTRTAAVPTTFTQVINYNSISLRPGTAGAIIQGIYKNMAGTASIATVRFNNFHTTGHTVPSSGAIAFITNETNGDRTTTISDNTFTDLSVNTTGNVSFIINSTTIPAGGSKTTNTNRIVTAFQKTGAGGTVTLYQGGDAPVASPPINDNNISNNFSNITLTGATTMAGWVNNAGASRKLLNANTFNNWVCGSGPVTVLSIGSSEDTQGPAGATSINNITADGDVTGIRITGGFNVPAATSNTIQNITAGGNITGVVLNGVSATTGVNLLQRTTVRFLTSTGASTSVTGISVTGGEAVTLNRNALFALQANGTNGVTKGISITGGTEVWVNNNVIANLKTPNSNGANQVVGIDIPSGSTSVTQIRYVAHNTVHLDAASTGANFGTSGIYHGASTGTNYYQLRSRYNVIVNRSVPKGTGRTVALRRSASTLNNYVTNGADTLNSNRNLYYAGVPGPNNLIYSDGSNNFQTLAEYKALSGLAPRDQASATELPAFKSLDASAGDPTIFGNFLRIDPTVPTYIESAGPRVYSVSTDVDNQPRWFGSTYTPEAGSNTGADMGADEFSGIQMPTNPPTISYTPLNAGCADAPSTLTATITSGAGIPTSGIALPRLAFRVNGGSWTWVTGTHAGGDSYTFSFANALDADDLVEYYVVAQDNAGLVAMWPQGGGTFASNPPSATAPPAPDSYTVLLALSGTYLVGSAQPAPWNTLTAALESYAVNCVVGAVVFELTDATYNTTTGETFPLVVVSNPVASSVNTLTIRPATGVSATVSGDINGPLVDLDGAKYVTIDGVNVGGSTLTLSNSNTGVSANTVRFNNQVVNGSLLNSVLLGSTTGTGTQEGAVVNIRGKNDNAVVSGNDIGAAGTNLPTRGILGFDSGVSGPQVLVPSSGFTTVGCGAPFSLYDHGGTGNYGNYANGYAVLENLPGETITLTGSYYTESSWDYIRIYNGVGTGGTLLQSYTGSGTANFTSTPGQTVTVAFTSDGSGVYSGFEFQVACSGWTPVATSPTTISNNLIHDFHSPASAARGIQLNGVENGWTISGNRFYQTAARSTSGGSHWMIDVSNTTAGGGHLISGNTLGYADSTGTGTYTLTGNTQFRAIRIQQPTNGSLASSITGNTIANLSYTAGAITGTGVSAPFVLIMAESGLVNITNNSIGSQGATGNIFYSGTYASSAAIETYGIYSISAQATNITGNSIGGLDITPAAAYASTNAAYRRLFAAIAVNPNTSTPAITNISDNLIGGTVANSISNPSTAYSSMTFGIMLGGHTYSYTPNATVTGNTVRNITAADGRNADYLAPWTAGIWCYTNATGSHTVSDNTIHDITNTGVSSSYVTGIHFYGGTGSNTVADNLVHSLSAMSASATGGITGITVQSGTNVMVERNFIHSLNSGGVSAAINGLYSNANGTTFRNNMVRLGIDGSGANITSAVSAIRGIRHLAGTMNFWHNSVYIGGAGVAGGSSYALISETTSARDIRNNILYNARNGSGTHYAIYQSSASGLTSNFNNLHVPPFTTGSHLGYLAGNRTTLSDWQSYTNQDATSGPGDPKFISPDGTAATVDLHIMASPEPTPVEAAGVDVGVADDFDGQARSSFSPTDIGADAGNFTPGEAIPPTITASALSSPICNSGDVTLQATITDAGFGVPLAGDSLPVLYWSSNAGSSWNAVQADWVSGDAASSVYDFSFGGSAADGGTVQYYIVARDNGGNVATWPSGGTGPSYDPPAVSGLPSGIPSYTLLFTLSGTYQVGVGGDFTTLTQAVNAWNPACVTGAVVFELTDATYPSESFPIGILQNTTGASATNNLTIRPATGVNAVVTGAVSGNPLINLNGAQYVNIDGVALTGTTTLTLSNTSNSASVGTSTVRFIGGASNNIIQRTSVLGSSTVTGSSDGAVISFREGPSGNNNDTIANCLIGPAGTLLPLRAIHAYSPNALATQNTGVVIRDNELFDYSGTNARGIDIDAGCTDWTISNNKFYQTAARSLSTSHHVIELTSSTAGSGRHAITGNIIGYADGAGSDTTRFTSGTGTFRAIAVLSSADTSTIAGNTINALRYSGTAYGTTTSSPFSVIHVQGGLVKIQDNTIGSQTALGGLHFNAATSASSGTDTYGIYYTNTSAPATITGNTIGGVRMIPGGTTSSSSSYYRSFTGIYVNASSTLASTVSNNVVGGTVAGSIDHVTTYPYAYLRGIHLASTAGSMGNNTVRNLKANGGTASTTTAAMTGILSTSGNVTFDGNTVSDLVHESTVTPVHVYGMYATGGNGINAITGNTVRKLSATASSSYVRNLYGIHFTGNGSNTVSGNLIDSLVVGTGSSGAHVIQGLYYSGGSNTNTVSGNTIRSLRTAGTGSSTLYGLYYAGGTGTSTVEKNFIHSMNASSGTGGLTYGLLLTGGATTCSNNMIRLGVDADGNAITVAQPIYGLYLSSGSANNIWHNSVYIGGAGVGTAASTTMAFYSNTTAARDVRNNIFYNARGNASTGGNHYAYYLSSLAGLTSNNNNLHAAALTTQGGHVGFYSVARATIEDWQSATGQDALSGPGNPKFISPDGTAATVDLHIMASPEPTPVEAAGVDVGVTEDFDGQVRSGLTPTDIGADAGDFTPGEAIPPTISASALSSPSCYDAAGRTITATIADAGFGVPLEGDSLPVLRWRVNGGGWNTVQGIHVSGDATSSTYDFVLGAGAGFQGDDVVQYFIVASDMGGNLASWPVGATGMSTLPSLGSTSAHGSPNTYTLLHTLSGTYEVGVGGDFTTLTQAVIAWNSACVTDAVVFELTDADYSSSETYPVTVLQNVASSAVNTLTIRPATGVAATVSANYGGPMIDLNGADYVTIDGVNTGGSTLTLSNASTSASAATIRFINDAVNDSLVNTIVLGSSTGTGTGVIFLSTGSSTGNDNLYIANNEVGPVGTNYPARAIYSAGTSTLALHNSDVTITGNRIHDFNGSDSRGITLASGSDKWMITGNRIYRSITGSVTSIHRLIDITSTTSGSGGHTVSGNILGYASDAGTGTYTFTSNAQFRAIRIQQATSGSVLSTITNNTIGGISHTGASAVGYGTGSPFALIMAESGVVDITGNTIGSQSATDDIVYTNTYASSSYVETYGIAYAGYQGASITDNTLGGLTITPGGSSSYYRTFSAIGVVPTSSSTFSAVVSDNTIGGSVANSISNPGNAAGSQLRGIQFGTPMHSNYVPSTTVSNNVVRNLTAAGGLYHQANAYSYSYANESSLTGIWYSYGNTAGGQPDQHRYRRTLRAGYRLLQHRSWCEHGQRQHHPRDRGAQQHQLIQRDRSLGLRIGRQHSVREQHDQLLEGGWYQRHGLWHPPVQLRQHDTERHLSQQHAASGCR